MKERLDVLLLNKGLFDSREKAKASIMAGIVYVDNQKIDKAGTLVDIDSNMEVRGDTCPYVSRGGLKLEKAISSFNIELNEKFCMDIGASTGGFTDCMLKNGANKVYSIDVGYGQLDYKLRTHPNVVNLEKTNVRYLDYSLIKDPIDFISIDVSFISLKHIFPVCKDLLKDDGFICSLVKPQFEAGKNQVGKNGIVKDKDIHKQVIKNVINYAIDNKLYPLGLDFSPVKGAKGNIEYLLYLSKKEAYLDDLQIDSIIELSHSNLD